MVEVLRDAVLVKSIFLLHFFKFQTYHLDCQDQLFHIHFQQVLLDILQFTPASVTHVEAAASNKDSM